MKKVFGPADPPRTLNSLWQEAVLRYAQREAVRVQAGGRPVSVTYGELESRAVRLGRGLIELGLREGDRVAVLATAGDRRLAGLLAVLGNRALVVTGVDPNGPGELFDLLSSAEARFALIGDRQMLRLARGLRERLPRLEAVVVLEEGYREQETTGWAYPFAAVLALGERAPRTVAETFRRRRESTLPADPAAILYTPGASEAPKGAVLSHAALACATDLVPSLPRAGASGRLLALLPSGHFLELGAELGALRCGAAIACAGAPGFPPDLAGLRPTWVVGVPQAYRHLQRAALEAARRGGRGPLYDRLYRRSLEVIRQWRESGGGRERGCRRPGSRTPRRTRAGLRDRLSHRLADLLFYRRARSRLSPGGRLAAAVCCGDSLPEDLDDFYQVIGVPLLEGYGLTEAGGLVCLRGRSRCAPATAGPPLPGVAVRVVDPRGMEIPGPGPGLLQVSGPQLMSGYHRDPRRTERALQADRDGRLWLNTGDIGCRNARGEITLLGPGRIESVLESSEYVERAMIVARNGEGLSALIVPDRRLLERECRILGIELGPQRLPEPADQDLLRELYLEILNDCLSGASDFREADLLQTVTFTRPFSREDGTLTGSLKLRRPRIHQREARLLRSLLQPARQLREAV